MGIQLCYWCLGSINLGGTGTISHQGELFHTECRNKYTEWKEMKCKELDTCKVKLMRYQQFQYSLKKKEIG